MSDLKAVIVETKASSRYAGFHIDGYEKIGYDFPFIDGAFNVENPNLADYYKRWKRCLAITDLNIYNIHGKQMEKCFEHYVVEFMIYKTKISEKAKTITAFLSIVDSINNFRICRKFNTLALPPSLKMNFD